MNRHKSILVATLGIGLVGAAGAGAWRYSLWNSEPEQLKRACYDASLGHLVAPSTAKLAGFRLLRAGDPSLLERELVEDFHKKETAYSQANDVYVKADAAQKRFESTEMANFKERVERHQLSLDEGLHLAQTNSTFIVRRAEATVAKDAAEQEMKKASKAYDDYHAKGLSEVALGIDAQNRAGAMLRMYTVCTYPPSQDVKAEIAQLVFAKPFEP